MTDTRNEGHRDQYLAIDSIPMPALFGSGHTILASNEAAGQLLGLSAESLHGKPLLDFVLGVDRPQVGVFLEKVQAGVPVQASLDVRFIGAGGRIVPLVANLCRRDTGRGERDFFALLTLPAEGNQKMSELQESDEHFRRLAESTPIAILLYQDDKWVFANAAAERITGYSSSELAVMNFWDFVHPDFVQIGRERGKKRQSGRQTVPSYEIKIITKPGVEKWVMINGATTHFRGRTAGLINVMEITELKRIQEELEATNKKLHAINEELVRSQRDLERSEYRYRDIFDHFPVGMFQTRFDGGFITANNELARILGYASGADVMAAGDSAANYYPDPGERDRILNDVRTEGHVEGYETRLMRRNGEHIWVSLNISLKRGNDGSEDYLEGYMQDVAARKLAEEEKALLEKQLIHAQKMEAIGRLAGGIAHDFNNLLTAIMGNAEIALKVKEDSVKDEHVNDVLLISKKAADLTRQLLAFSRKQVIKPVVIEVNAFLDGLERMLRRIIGEDIVLVLTRDPAPVPVKADPSQIEQMIVNLVVNARDAMPIGGTISISSSNEIMTSSFLFRNEAIMPGPYVRIDVTDNGAGMESEIIENIFEPFYSTKGDLGTGLGLSTVYGIVRQNNGFITVRSEKGKGSTFSIYLPKSTESGLPESRKTPEPVRKTPVSQGETILVVEDDENVRKLLVRNLSDEGYRVLEASDSREAVELWAGKGRQVDLVLSDVVLPDISGPSLIEKLRKVRTDFRVIFMSGYTEQNVIDHEVLKQGAFLMSKPFLPSELKKKIREVLSG